MAGRPRDQAAQRVPPHYFPGYCHHCSYWGPPGAGDGSGARGCGWYHGGHEMKAEGRGQGSGPGPGYGYGVAWTCQGWGCGTWVQAAPGCCHPRPLSWHSSCLCCCWPTLRQAARSGGKAGHQGASLPNQPLNLEHANPPRGQMQEGQAIFRRSWSRIQRLWHLNGVFSLTPTRHPEDWPTHLEGLSDTNEDAVGVAVIAQDEVSMALGQ